MKISIKQYTGMDSEIKSNLRASQSAQNMKEMLNDIPKPSSPGPTVPCCVAGKPDLNWEQDYLEFCEEHFEDIFQAMYEERFIDRIFGEDQQMTREDFVTAIEGSAAMKALEALNDLQGKFQFFEKKKKKGKHDNPDDTNESMLEDMADGPVDWLFSPKSIR